MRPDDLYNYGNLISDLVDEVGPDRAFPLALSYNLSLSHDISHSLMRQEDPSDELFDGFIYDYRGERCEVKAHKAIALYEGNKELGELIKRANRENVEYLRSTGFDVDISMKYAQMENGVATFYVTEEDGPRKIL